MRKAFKGKYIASLGLILSCAPVSFAAAPVFNTGLSSAILTHTDDLLAGSPNIFAMTLPGSSIPSSSPPLPFQINHTFSQGVNPNTSSTVATGSVYQITTTTDMAAALVTGTGVIQTNVPGHFYTGASELDININYYWTIGAGGFPPLGHPPGVAYQFTVGGIVGEGGSDEFKVNLIYSNGMGTQIGSVKSDTLFNTAGAFTKTISGTASINGGTPMAAGSTLELSGTIDFLAINDEGPSNIEIVNQDGNTDVGDETQQNLPEPASISLAIAAGVMIMTRRRSCLKQAFRRGN